MRLAVSITIVCAAAGISASAQSLSPEVIASAGEFYSSAGGSIQWTMGETMTETYGNASNFVTQGFEQPENFGVSVAEINPVNVGLYPNPTTDHLTLEFGNGSEGDYVVEIFDVLGQRISSQQVSVIGGSKVELGLGAVANGVYFLTVKKTGSSASSTFKVNKVS